MDEIRAWIAVLQMTEAILPCPMCQNHYKAWLKANPLKLFHDLRNPAAFREAAQSWLWRLHNTINKERSVAEFSLEDTKALYSDKKSVQQPLDKLLEVLEKAKLQRLIDGIFAREWKGKLNHLRRFIGV